MKNFVQSVFGRLGYRITKIDSVWKANQGIDHLFSLVKGLGFAPKHVMDVGANHGEWTRTALRYFPAAEYTLIEPQVHLRAHVQDLVDGGYKIRWISAGAGDKPGHLPFSMATRDDSSTFALSEPEAREAGFQQVVVEVKTLNEIAASSGSPPDMVKIDAEGMDLKVLAGASHLFGVTDIFFAEATVCSPCENRVVHVAKFMDDAGYQLIDITDLNRSPKHEVLWLCELAFLRKGSPLLERATSYE
jgi:FkbM family methyltransferase